MHSNAVSLEKMVEGGQLLTIEDARDRLRDTEPLVQHTFALGDGIEFQLGSGWSLGQDAEPADAHLVTPGGARYQLTKQAMLEAAAFPGIPRKYGQRLRPSNLEADVNWHYQHGMGEGEFKILAQEREGQDPLALAMCRGTIQPFSNLELLDSVIAGAQEHLGADGARVLVDAKFNHDLERTNLRLIFPDVHRVITGTRVDDDTWSTGIQFQNSQIGIKQTRVDGYLFRYWCTNGCTDTLASAGALKRRSVSDPDQAYEWARRSVEEVLGGLENTLDAVQALTEISLTGEGEVGRVLSDLYARHHVPVAQQHIITAAVADLTGNITMYDIMQEVTRAANRQDLSPRVIAGLMSLGGHVTHGGARCNSDAPCGRLLPDDWEAVTPAADVLAS